MAEYDIALGIKPPSIDVAAPLMAAAKIRAAEQSERQNEYAFRQNVLGTEARGLAAFADKPEFASKWAEAHDRMAQQGIISPQAHAQLRDNPSPLVLQQLLAQTQSPELAFREKALTQTTKEHAQTFGLQQQQFEEAKRQHGIAEEKPIPVPPGTELVTPKGQKVYGDAGVAKLDPPTIDAMARQAMAGDTSVFTNLGRGAQGAENVIAVRKRIAEINSGSGETGAEQANRNAEFFGVKAGQRTLGTKQANIELASTEFKQILPIVQEASKAVNRTNYPDLNKIIQAFETKTGDPNIVKFGGGINTLVNLYARAISPTGVGTVSDKDHAREILQKAWSQGQFDAAAGMMSQEIDAALRSPEKVRDEMRKRFISGQSSTSTTRTGTAPAKAIEMLKADPKTAAKFDEIFGSGEAAKILGGK